MTLSVRNRFLAGLFFCSLALMITLLSLLCIAVMKNAVFPPPHLHSSLMTRLPFLSYSFRAVLISIVIFMIYVPLLALLIYRNFEKTQSIEVFFFSGFLIGCMAESLRLLIPLFGLWQSFSPLFILTGRIVFFGRLLCPLSFFFSSVMTTQGQRTDIERNFIIMVAVSILFAAIIPRNTVKPTGLCTIYWGFALLFIIVRGLIFAAAAISMFSNAVQQENRSLILAAIGYIALVIGYIFLNIADNYFNLAAGTLLLAVGTYEYLSKIHHLYLWK